MACVPKSDTKMSLVQDQKSDYFTLVSESLMQMNHLRSARMNMIELRRSQVMTDLVFLCCKKGHTTSGITGIHGHRIVLATASALFADKDIPLNEVDLQDTDQHIVEAVLDFVYLGCVPSLHKYTDLINMTLTAYRLQITRLYAICFGRLLGRLNVCNASEVLELAKICGDNGVKNKIIHYLGMHLSTSFRATTYLLLDQETLEDVITQYLKEVKENQKDLTIISQLIHSWADEDPPNRLRQISNLFLKFKIDSYVLAKAAHRKLLVAVETGLKFNEKREQNSYTSNFNVISVPQPLQTFKMLEKRGENSQATRASPRKSHQINLASNVEVIDTSKKEPLASRLESKVVCNAPKAAKDGRYSVQSEVLTQKSTDILKPPKALPRAKLNSFKSPRLTPEQIKVLKCSSPRKLCQPSASKDLVTSPEKGGVMADRESINGPSHTIDLERPITPTRKSPSTSPRSAHLTNKSPEPPEAVYDPSADGDAPIQQQHSSVMICKVFPSKDGNVSPSPKEANWKILNRQSICEALKSTADDTTKPDSPSSSDAASLKQSETKPSFIVLQFSKKSFHYCLQKFALDIERWTQTKVLFKDLEAFEDAAVTIGANILFLVGGVNVHGQIVGSTIGISLTQYNTINYPPMRLTRAKSTAVFYQGFVIVIGGESKYGRPVGYVEKLNPETNNWFPMASLRKPRCSCQAVVTKEGNIIVLGGWDVDGCLLSCELYDPFTNSWSQVLKLPSFFLMSEPKAYLHDNNIFVVPVIGPTLPALFDLRREVWLAPSSSTGITPGKAKAIAVFGDQVFIMDYNLAVYTYYLHSHHWEKVSPSRKDCSSGCHVIFYNDPRRETETSNTFSDEDEFSDGKAEGSGS